VYATVGTQEKREFLTSAFGIPDDRIFSSRSTEFAKKILDHTNGQGVNVILNSLTGDLLDESWRIIAEGGTMVEIGKKDILAHASLYMEPFSRNGLYRAFDLAHKDMDNDKLSRQVISLLLIPGKRTH
jgi:NADPH:quinone reductase-like Zn-dependent oxidoreductase